MRLKIKYIYMIVSMFSIDVDYFEKKKKVNA